MELKEIKWELLKEEGITKEDLELVDLDIEFSPVMPIKGSEPMEAIKLRGGKYQVPDCPIIGMISLSEEDLKIMRYRYLINR